MSKTLCGPCPDCGKLIAYCFPIHDCTPKIKCCLCGKMIARHESCDPHPLRKRGRCCHRCDDLKVTPARLAAKGIPQAEAKVIGQNIHRCVKYHRKRMREARHE